MLTRRKLSLRLSDALKQKLLVWNQESGLQNPIPSISEGTWDENPTVRLIIGYYEKDLLPTNDPIRIIEADGIEFVIIQDWLCDTLDGKTLDIVSGKLIVR